MTDRRLGQRRSHEEAARQRSLLELLAAGEDARTALAQRARVARVVLVTRLSRDRTQPVCAPRRIADGERLQLLEELCGEWLGHLPLDVQPGERRAFLTAHAEGRAQDAARGPIEIGPRGDDAGVLAPHLGDA